MAFGTDRQMFDVDLTCAKCGAHISQLPFQPSGDRPVYCSDYKSRFSPRPSGWWQYESRSPRSSADVSGESHLRQLW